MNGGAEEGAAEEWGYDMEEDERDERQQGEEDMGWVVSVIKEALVEGR